MDKSKNFIWVDLEMTGLDPIRDRILEISAIITDFNLNIIAESPSLSIFQEGSILSTMDIWNFYHHRKSGLIDSVANSKINENKAELLILEFVNRYSIKKKSPMCGNSIGYDRCFLMNHMPNLEDFFHYRNLDVSSIKILYQKWCNNKKDISLNKKSTHRAKHDILESIVELKRYKDAIFNVYK